MDLNNMPDNWQVKEALDIPEEIMVKICMLLGANLLAVQKLLYLGI